MTFPHRRVALWTFVLVVLWGAAILLAAPVHSVVSDLGWVSSSTEGFARTLRRLLLVGPLVVVLFAFRPWRHGDFRAYGLRGGPAPGRHAGVGAACGLAAGAGLLAVQFALGTVRWEDSLRWGEAGYRAAKYVVSGVVVGLVEEWAFRGWMQRQFSRLLPVLLATVVVSSIFALAHAFKPSGLSVEVSHDAAGATEALRVWLLRAIDPRTFGPAFLGLFLLGFVLTAAYLRTRTLWTAVGAHAAGMWFLSTYGALTEWTVERTAAGGKVLYDGWPAWVLLAGLAIALWPRRGAEAPSADVGVPPPRAA